MSRDRLEEAQHGGSSTRVCVRRKGSRPQSEGGEEEEEEGGGAGRPWGGINERIDLGVQHTSAVLSLSVQVDLRDRAAMDLQLHLGCICMNVNKSGSEGGPTERFDQSSSDASCLFDFNVTERNLND